MAGVISTLFVGRLIRFGDVVLVAFGFEGGFFGDGVCQLHAAVIVGMVV